MTHGDLRSVLLDAVASRSGYSFEVKRCVVASDLGSGYGYGME